MLTKFLDTVVYKGIRSLPSSSAYWISKHISSRLKPSSHPLGVKKALRLQQPNSSKTTFEENIKKFKSRLLARGYPKNLIEKFYRLSNLERPSALNLIEKISSDVKFRKAIGIELPFVTQYQPSLPNLKHVLMGKWHFIQNQPCLREIFIEPPLIPRDALKGHRRGKKRGAYVLFFFLPRSRKKQLLILIEV